MTEIPKPPLPEDNDRAFIDAGVKREIDEYVAGLPDTIAELRRVADEIEALLPHLPRHNATCDTDGCGVTKLYDEMASVGMEAARNVYTLQCWSGYIETRRVEQVEHLRKIAVQN